ncbi:hypothetical protein JOB18_004637 [Solea senegalensis]|uniref:Uncharacterized protein n=1 Tax=Solea senegalensis TaxID=28829 RepID=A0AAV6PQV6_SOLSE|nr:hypothetical protein JOB18_004637 [Solea senegalensis]
MTADSPGGRLSENLLNVQTGKMDVDGELSSMSVPARVQQLLPAKSSDFNKTTTNYAMKIIDHTTIDFGPSDAPEPCEVHP